MIVYLIRHGDAAGIQPGVAATDAERPLTPEGIERFRQAAQGHALLIRSLERIVSSPLTRARQTAELLAEAIEPDSEIEFSDDLHYGAPPARAQAMLQAELLEGTESIALVGHEPHLGMLCGMLVTGADRASIPLSKGMCVAVEIAAAQVMFGRLRFALSQKSARRLARK